MAPDPAIQIPRMLLIGSSGRNSGKTTLACSIIGQYKGSAPLVGVKVTTIRDRNEPCPRGLKSCGVCAELSGDYCITREKDKKGAKDTSRLLQAGAGEVFWLRVLEKKLEKGVRALLKRLPRGAAVVAESNRLRLAVEPGLFLMVVNTRRKMKASAESVIAMADRVVRTDGGGYDMDVRNIIFTGKKWKIRRGMTAIILAGGKSERMGHDKALMRINGVPAIQKLRDALAPHFDEILVSTHARGKQDFFGLRTVADEQPGRGPLMGIYSALKASANEINFVIACDIPEIDISFVRKLASRAEDFDAVVARTGPGLLEPLFSVYRKSVIAPMAKILAAGKNKISDVFEECRVRYMDMKDRGWYRNINTPEEYRDL